MAVKNKYKTDTRIHVYRAMKRMSQQELADRANVSRQTIAQLERNKYNPSLLLAHTLAEILDTTIEELFRITPNE